LNTCNYAFGIDFGEGSGPTPCHLTDAGNSTSPANTQSFYAVPCAENAANVISWGYNPQYGFATGMCRQPTQQDAFFGFNDVNTHKNFSTVGPNKVYPLGTFS
jgi:hypothetical protein